MPNKLRLLVHKMRYCWIPASKGVEGEDTRVSSSTLSRKVNPILRQFLASLNSTNANEKSYYRAGMESGVPILHFVISCGTLGTVKATKTVFMALLKAGAKPNLKCSKGYTALHRAVQHYHRKPWAINALMEYGANPKIKTRDGRTLADLVERRLKQGTPISGINTDGLVACMKSHGIHLHDNSLKGEK